MAAKAYQFRQMLKHEYMKPPTIMPATELAEPLSDSQAPIVPPTAMLASNQKIQIASLVNGACRFGAHHFLGMSAPIGSAPLASNRPPTCWLASHHGVIERMLMAFECSALPSMASEPPAIRVCSLVHMPLTIFCLSAINRQQFAQNHRRSQANSCVTRPPYVDKRTDRNLIL